VSGWSEEKQLLFCFVPTFALTFAVIGFEQGSPPVAFSTVLLMLLLDVVGYMFGGWYLSEVFPGEGSTPRKLWFMFEPNYWRGTCSSCAECFSGATLSILKANLLSTCEWFWCCCCRLCCNKDKKNKEDDDDNGDRTQEVELRTQQPTMPVAAPEFEGPEELVEAVKISGLRKEFGSHVAVHGLDLTMYEGEIFALLGHNGAGKYKKYNHIRYKCSVMCRFVVFVVNSVCLAFYFYF
jgi:hypothetical protein